MSYHEYEKPVPVGCSPQTPQACCGSYGFAPGYPKNNGMLVGCNNDLFVTFYGGKATGHSLKEVDGLFSPTSTATDPKNLFSEETLRILRGMPSADASTPTKPLMPASPVEEEGMSDGVFYALVAIGTIAVVGGAVWYTRRRK